jgi:hypothetical protein
MAVLALLVSGAACGSTPATAPVLSDPSLPRAGGGANEAPRALDSGSGATTATAVAPTPGERRLEIENLTKPLWFGWYSAVAAGDIDALGQTVARSRIHADAVTAIETADLDFTEQPRIEEYDFSVVEVLRDDVDCIVAAVREDPTAFLADGVEAERIGVFWLRDERWYLATSWTIDAPEFAWGDDCSLMVREYA